jgi:hypothetical protein
VYGNIAFETLFGLSHLDQTGVDMNELFQAQINSEKSGAHGGDNTSLRMNETNVRSFFLALKTKAPAGLDWASLPPERLWSEQRLVMTYDAENSFFEPEVVVRFGFHRQILKEALKIGKEAASLPPASRRRQLVLDPMIGWVLDTGVALSWEI